MVRAGTHQVAKCTVLFSFCNVLGDTCNKDCYPSVSKQTNCVYEFGCNRIEGTTENNYAINVWRERFGWITPFSIQFSFLLHLLSLVSGSWSLPVNQISLRLVAGEAVSIWPITLTATRSRGEEDETQKKKLKICRSEKGAGRNRSEKKEKELKLCLCFFLFLQVTADEERRKPFQTHPVHWFFLRRRVGSCTASGGNAWSRRTATVPAVPEGLPSNSWIFWGLFCKFKIV